MPAFRGLRRAIGPLACGCALLATLGCGNSPPRTPVSGRVTFDGQPLKFGTIMFQHQSGGQPASGTIGAEGKYQLADFKGREGALVGPNLVRITSFEGNDPNWAGRQNSQLPPGEVVLGRSLIPPKYGSFGTSGLKVDVLAGEPQTINFELSSK
jgi:hypothetical protein